jgi:hypothetical protein
MLGIAGAARDRAGRTCACDSLAGDRQFAEVGGTPAAIEDEGISKYMIMIELGHQGTLAKLVFL